MNTSFPFIIESLVAVLLLLTIGYCAKLNRRLKLLKTDAQIWRTTITELLAATDNAERAIAGLRATVQDCDGTLGERLRSAERFSAEMAQQLDSGSDILERLIRVTGMRPVANAPDAPPPDAKTIAARAKAFADRTRTRANGLAA